MRSVTLSNRLTAIDETEVLCRLMVALLGVLHARNQYAFIGIRRRARSDAPYRHEITYHQG